MTQKDKEFFIFQFQPKLQEGVKWLFERRKIDGLFPVFFILYSYKHKLHLSMKDDLIEYKAGEDSLQDRLFNASLLVFGGDITLFLHLADIQKMIKSIRRSLFDEVYPYLIDSLLCMTDLVGGTQMQPNSRIAFTVANILREHGCKTVFGAFSGIGIYALTCEGMEYTGAEPYAPANLIAEVLCDAFRIEKTEFLNENPLREWTRRRFDAVIGNLPVDADFFSQYRADHLLHEYNQKQNDFIVKLIKQKTAIKTAALLIHFEFANYSEYDETRKRICEQGMLETVIALPERIFQNSLVPTYLLILDMTGGHKEAVFVNATQSMERQSAFLHTYRSNLFDIRESVLENEQTTVSYEQIAQASWSFNPAVYIQNAVAREGQELIRLGDLVNIPAMKLVEGERYVGYEALSENYSRAYAGILPTVPSGYEDKLIEGPSILIALTKGNRREEQKIKCGICRERGLYSAEFYLTVLKPDPEKILPEYLVQVLMSDPSFPFFYKSIQEYYTDNIRNSHLLERRIPIFPDLAVQKKIVLEALGREDMSKISYSIVMAGAGKNLGRYRSDFAKYGCNIIANVETVEGPEGLERLLEKISGNNVPVSRRVDAVVFQSDIRLNETNDEPFGGMDAVLDLKLIHQDLKFFASSKYSLDEIRKEGKISLRRLSTLKEGYFFMTEANGNPKESLIVAVREELDRDLSPSTRIRSRHQSAFKATEWLDEKYSSKDIRATEVISEFLMAAEEGVDSSSNLSMLRNVAHRVIEILKDCHAVPPLDNGAIPHLLYDGMYVNHKDGKTYFQDVTIMKKSLSSSLISMIDIGNEGTHTFRISPNLGAAMLQTLLEFVTWMYEKREEFSKILTNYWHFESEEQDWEETSGPAELRYVKGRPFWICGNILLIVPKEFDIQEGDMVKVRARKTDRKHQVPGVFYYAKPCGQDNPDGYIVDREGR